MLTYWADYNAEKFNFFEKVNPALTGYMPHRISAEKGHKNICRILLEYGAKPGFICKYKLKSPLHYAAKYGSFTMVNALLNSECDLRSIFKPNKYQNYTPLHYAIQSGNQEVVSILELKEPSEL